MYFTKVISLIALTATSSLALPEPIPVTPVSGNATLNAMTDAATTVVVGFQTLTANNLATVHALIAQCIESAEQDEAAAAASISSIVGGTQAYADALTNILTTMSACVAASA